MVCMQQGIHFLKNTWVNLDSVYSFWDLWCAQNSVLSKQLTNSLNSHQWKTINVSSSVELDWIENKTQILLCCCIPFSISSSLMYILVHTHSQCKHFNGQRSTKMCEHIHIELKFVSSKHVEPACFLKGHYPHCDQADSVEAWRGELALLMTASGAGCCIYRWFALVWSFVSRTKKLWVRNHMNYVVFTCTLKALH